MNKAAKLAIVGAVSLLAATSAQAMLVTSAGVVFDNFSESNASAGFDLSSNTIVGESLSLGIDNNFQPGGFTPLITDQVNFTVSAPTGFVITKITYVERVDWLVDTGLALVTATMSANGDANPLGTFFFTPASDAGFTLDTDYDYTVAQNVTNVAISLTNTLGAFDGAMIEKSLATLAVEIAPVPLPASLFLLGPALAGMVVLRRRQT